MKRIFVLSCCIAIIFSCTKENGTNSDISVPTFTGNVEVFESGCLSKTQLDNSNILWETGDNIVIFDNTANTTGKYTSTGDGASTNFSFVDGTEATSGPYYACYPYENCLSIGENVFKIKFASEQTYKNNSFTSRSFPMVAYSTSNELKFMNVGGLMLISLKTNNLSIQIKKLLIKADQLLCGDVSVSYDGITSPSITNIVDGSNTLTINFDTPLSINSTATPVYVSVPGNTYTNVEVKVITDDDVEQTLKASSVEIIRSKKTTMNVAANRLFTDIASLNSTQSGYSSRQNGNCYVINKPGSYKLPLLEGTTTTDLVADAVDVIWQLSGYRIIENTSLSLDGKYLEFNTTSTLPQGNATVAAMKDGKIIWSWHIWSSSYKLGVDDVDYNGVKWMDRNIGGYLPITVTINESPYVYYKSDLYFAFNRKDPIRPQSSVLDVVDYLTAQQNPTVLYSNKLNNSWTSEPDKFNWIKENPCPIGYKIPSSGFPVIEGTERIGGGMCWMQNASHLDGYNGNGYNYNGATMYWVDYNSTTRAMRLTRDNKIEDSSRAAYLPIRCVKKDNIE